jgi:hypothetical protein
MDRFGVRHAWVLIVTVLAAGCGSSGESDDAGAANEGGGSDGNSSDGCEKCTDGPALDAQDASATDASDDGPTSECVAKINAYRAKVSAPPLASKDDEVACALDQATKGAADLADSGTTTFHKYYGQCSESYQNECWYSVSDPSAVIDWCLAAFWAEGPPDTGINHYSVMTDPKSTKVACALYKMSQGGYWMTNDFY